MSEQIDGKFKRKGHYFLLEYSIETKKGEQTVSEPYVEEWKSKIINELQSAMEKEEHIHELNLNIKSGVAILEYSVRKAIPLELRIGEKK